MRGSISALPLLVLLLVFWIPKDPPPAQRCPHASYRDLSFRVTRLCTAIALARVRGTGCASGPPASHCRGFSPCGVRALRRQASVIALRGLSSCGAPAELPRGPWPRGNRQRHPAPSAEAGLGGGRSGQALGHRTGKPQELQPTTRPRGANEPGPFFSALITHHAPFPPHFSMSLQGGQMTTRLGEVS